MTDYEPREGDRVLVTGPCLPPGGMSGTVTPGDHLGEIYVWGDGMCEVHGTGHWWVPRRVEIGVSLLHRPAPPRPQVESFTRSDGQIMEWFRATGELSCGWVSFGQSFTPEDARAVARMYEQGAEQMEWDAEYGEKP